MSHGVIWMFQYSIDVVILGIQHLNHVWTLLHLHRLNGCIQSKLQIINQSNKFFFLSRSCNWIFDGGIICEFWIQISLNSRLHHVRKYHSIANSNTVLKLNLQKGAHLQHYYPKSMFNWMNTLVLSILFVGMM